MAEVDRKIERVVRRRRENGNNDPIPVLILFQKNIDCLDVERSMRALGVVLGTKIGDVMSADIPLDQIYAVAELKQIIRIECG